MNNTIIFLSLIILLISMLLIIKIKIWFDINNNLIRINILIFGIKLIEIKINIIGLTYTINNSKKYKTLNLKFLKEESYFISQIKNNIIKKLYYDNLVLESVVGFESASGTAIIHSCIDNLCQYYSNKLLLLNKDTKLYYCNNCDFVKSRIFIYFEAKVYFTIFDLIFAIIMSIYKRGRYAKQKRA